MFRTCLVFYFPAYLPVLLLFFKWLTLSLVGVYNYASWIPYLAFASLAFDIWAITSKLKGETLHIDETSRQGEGILVVVFFICHLCIYIFNVLTWLTPSNSHLGSIFLRLVAVL